MVEEFNVLLRINKYNDLDKRKLMDIYSESNFENTDYFYPDERDKDKAVRMVEAGFMDCLKNDFYKKYEATYWILEENGIWLSALRTCLVKDSIFYIEALETRPDSRKRGYAAKLLNYVINTLKNDGSVRLCSCVSKKNIASIIFLSIGGLSLLGIIVLIFVKPKDEQNIVYKKKK